MKSCHSCRWLYSLLFYSLPFFSVLFFLLLSVLFCSLILCHFLMSFFFSILSYSFRHFVFSFILSLFYFYFPSLFSSSFSLFYCLYFHPFFISSTDMMYSLYPIHLSSSSSTSWRWISLLSITSPGIVFNPYISHKPHWSVWKTTLLPFHTSCSYNLITMISYLTHSSLHNCIS